MNNAFAYSRDMETMLGSKLTKRMEGACLSIMRYLVLHANHSPGLYAGQPIGRGEIVAGRGYLADKTGLSEKTVRSALTQLEKVKSIRKKGAIKGASGTALYLIENYEDWDALSKKGPAEGPARGQQGARSKEEQEGRTRIEEPPLPPMGKVINILVLEFPEQPPACELTTLNDSDFEYEPISRQWIAEETPATLDLFEATKEKWGDQVVATIRPFADEDSSHD